MRPRIGIDYTPAVEQGGGIGRYVRELTRALAAIDPPLADYRLFVAGAGRRPLPSPPSPAFTFAPTRITPDNLARLWKRARVPLPVETFTGPLDVYHATDFVLPPVRRGTRTLLTVHDLSFVRRPETAAPSLRAYLDRVVPASVRRATHVLADSDATRRDLIALYAAADERITVLYSGVDARFVPVHDESLVTAMRAKYSLNERPYVLSVGTVQPRKNYARLVQAVAALRHDDLDIELAISGGKGWLDDPIYEAVRDAGIERYVRFLGFADDADLPGLYSGAACVAIPSLYEGFGLPVLEAMACGTPVVTSNVSSLPEVAGEAALLIDPEDTSALVAALRALLTDSSLSARLRAAGLEQARRFSWERSARELETIYRRLAGDM